MEATAAGRLPALLEERGDELTPELAGEARNLFTEAVQGGNLGLAQTAAMAAASLWLRLGNREQGLVSYVDSLQIDYMRAETPEAYAPVREQFLAARGMAEEVGA